MINAYINFDHSCNMKANPVTPASANDPQERETKTLATDIPRQKAIILTLEVLSHTTPHTQCRFEVKDRYSFSSSICKSVLFVLYLHYKNLLKFGFSNQNSAIFCTILGGRDLGVWNIHHWHQDVNSWIPVEIFENSTTHYLQAWA